MTMRTETPAEQKGRQQLYSDLWWLAEEMINTADAIGPVPDLAERALREHAKTLRTLIVVALDKEDSR